MNDVTMKLGSLPVENATEAPKRLNLLIWGPSGCGKSTLAATAPGKKLWLLFDNGGLDALIGRSDILVVDFTTMSDEIVLKFKDDRPFNLDRFLAEHPEIETVVIDSVTSFADMALQYGVIHAAKFGSTLEDPGFKGYGRKHAWVHSMAMNLNRVVSKAGRNIIFICHEDRPEKDKDGVVLFITMLLGSSLVVELPVRLSEIWHMEDTGRERRIAIRNCRNFKPMKSRMFLSTGDPEFVWKFNADDWDDPKNEPMTIANWFGKWKLANSKLPLPK